MSSSSVLSRISAWRSTLLTQSHPFIKRIQQQAKPIKEKIATSGKQQLRRFGPAVAIGVTAITFGVSTEARETVWSKVSALVEPMLDWHDDQTHGRRKRTLLTHYGVTRGGSILELLPGSGSTFHLLDASGDARALPLLWEGIDSHSHHWSAGRLQSAAGLRAGIPASQLEFHAADKSQQSVLELLKATPASSQQYILALHGLSPLFNIPTSLSSKALSNPSQPQRELESILSEVYRILKPGGRFIFIDECTYPSGSLARIEQDALSSLSLSHLKASGRTSPIDLVQTLPLVGFTEAHVEEWPEWVDSTNPRRGIKVLRVLDVDGKIVVDGLNGRHPRVAGIATKSIHSGPAQPAPISLLQPEQGNLGSMFTRR